MFTMGLDIGSTYTKGLILNEKKEIVAKAMEHTGSKLLETTESVAQKCREMANLKESDISYLITTGYGRHLIPFRDMQVTDLTAAARGAHFLFPGTRTILDIGGQTMKASSVDDKPHVLTFRLNDKCASGTGAFLEKTVRYMGYNTGDIGSLLNLSKAPVSISGVCAVFAESEVISHLSQGVPPEDIMFGAIQSLTQRSVQLIKRIKPQPEYTLIGGILRWKSMAKAIEEELKAPINLPEGDLPQYVAALGCAILAQIRLKKIQEEKVSKS